jgi:rhodanese-related sulfurtransferase
VVAELNSLIRSKFDLKMKDNWLNKLIIAVVLFVAVIIVGFLTMRPPALKYKLTEQQALIAAGQSGEEITLEKAKQIQLDKDPAYRFVDLRNANDFIKGHPDGAINIPLSKLLSEENLDIIKQADKDNKTLIFYGDDRSQATSPCLLLKQLGFENIKVLQAGYDLFANKQVMVSDSMPIPNYDAEAAHYNFAEFNKGQENAESGLSPKALPQKVVTKAKPKSTAPAAGGC